MTIDEDYKRFCLKCGWNDLDYDCISPSGEEVWQCPMYIHYHPDEVEMFNKSLERVKDGNK
jgi:hypothetical protein